MASSLFLGLASTAARRVEEVLVATKSSSGNRDDNRDGDGDGDGDGVHKNNNNSNSCDGRANVGAEAEAEAETTASAAAVAAAAGDSPLDLDLHALRTAALHTARGVGDAAIQAIQQRRVAANNSHAAAATAASGASGASASDQRIESSSPSTTSVSASTARPGASITVVPWGSGLDVHYVTPCLLGMAMPRAKIMTTDMSMTGDTGTGTADAAGSSASTSRPGPPQKDGRASTCTGNAATDCVEDADNKTPARSNTSRLISSESTARVPPPPPLAVTDDDGAGADIGTSTTCSSNNTKSPQRTPHRSLASSRASSRGASRTPSRNGSYDQLHAMAQQGMEMGSPSGSVGRRRRRRPGMSPLGAAGAGDVDGGGVRFTTEQQQQQQRRRQQLAQDPRMLDIQRSQSLSQMQYQNSKRGTNEDSVGRDGAQQPRRNEDGMPPNGPMTAKLRGNCPVALSTFLNNRHSDRFLCFNLTGSPADERTVLLLNHQVVNCPWTAMDVAEAERRSKFRAENCGEDDNEDDSISVDTSGTAASSGGSRSPSTPSLSALLDICYAIAAYHALSPQNVACVYCQNGKTRTGVAIACYLRFSGRVQSSLDGFRLFCRQCNMGSGDTTRMPRRQQPLERILTPNRDVSAAAAGCGASSSHANRSKQDVASLIPPSLLQLFHNFDDLIELRAWPNPQSLRLRAITLSGVPVDDLPVVEIWDSATGCVYSSHDSTTATNDDDGVADDSSKTRLFGEPAQWTDEEGFYLIDKPLRSEFTILCRFGGTVADDAYDPTKILFRYINHTAFLTWGSYLLTRDRVDIMRRYLGSFEDDFLVVLLFEPSKLDRSSALHLPPILSGLAALQRGFVLINDHHSLQSPFEVPRVLENCPPAWVGSVATKLANGDSNRRDEILASPQFVRLLSAIAVDEKRRAHLQPTPSPMKSLHLSINEGKGAKAKMEMGKDKCEDSNVDQTETSKSYKGGDPRAIRDRGINPDRAKGGKDDTPPDSGAASIKGSDTEDTNRNESNSAAGMPAKDPRSAVLGAIRAGGPSSEDPPKDNAGATQLPAGPRAAETAKDDTAPGNTSANPLSALFGAIRGRGGSNNKEKNEDPRGAVLSSIEAHGAEVEGTNRSVQQERDARGALLDAIHRRGQNTDKVDESEPAVDPRGALLGAIRAAGIPSKEEKEGGGDDDDTNDDRNTLLNVVTKKGPPLEDKNNEKAYDQSGGGSGQTGAAIAASSGAAERSIPKLDATSNIFLTLLDSMEFAGSGIPIDESSTHDDALAAYGHQLLCSNACLVEPSFAPRPGDVVDAFGPPPIDVKTDVSETRTDVANEDARTRPRLPLHEWKERHRQQSALHSVEIDDGGNTLSSLRDVVASGFVESGLLPFTLASTPRRTSGPGSAAADSLQYLWDPVASHFQYRDDIGACIALLSKMPRSGLRVEDLVHLLVESRTWSDSELLRLRQATSQSTMLPNHAIVADASLTHEGAAANVAAAISNNIQLTTGPVGGPNSTAASKGALAAADAISQRNDSVTDLAKGIEAGPELKRNGSSTGAADAAAAIAASQVKKQDENDDLALKDDPEWSKYYKMLKVGLPMGAVTNAMQRDGKDSAVMEFDQNRPLQIQLDEKNKYQDYQLSDWM